jgi:hypothetical protein
MITVTGGSIVTGIENDTKRSFDVDTITFQCQVNSVSGSTETFIYLIDSDGKEIIPPYRGPVIEEADLTTTSYSITNPCTAYLAEVESVIKDYFETANGAITFTIT